MVNTLRKKKRYVVWYHENTVGEITEMCGSDSIQNVDNRKETSNIVYDTRYDKDKVDWMRRKGAVGFKVVRGTITEYTPIIDLIKI